MSDQGSPSTGGGACGRSFCPSPPQLQLYRAIIFAAPVFFAFMLLLLFCFLHLWRRRGASIHSPMRGQFFAGLMATPPLEHGLSKSFRQRLPIMPYDEKFSSTCQETQCAVCLGDYQLDEKIQQLPACNHFFHLQCIDEWLAKNATCPICRTSLLMEEGCNGFVDGVQHQDDGSGSMEPPIARDEHRLWEERVISEVQDRGFLIRGGVSNMASSSGAPSFESSGGQLADEHTVNVERS